MNKILNFGYDLDNDKKINQKNMEKWIRKKFFFECQNNGKKWSWGFSSEMMIKGQEVLICVLHNFTDFCVITQNFV